MITYATSGNFASLSQVKPNFGNGVTFQNSSETLDFYANGTVVYKSGNAPSRRGDWTVDLRGQRKQIGNVTKDVPITVSIYISDRTITLKGYINYHVGWGNNIKSLKLNGKNWEKW